MTCSKENKYSQTPIGIRVKPRDSFRIGFDRMERLQQLQSQLSFLASNDAGRQAGQHTGGGADVQGARERGGSERD